MTQEMSHRTNIELELSKNNVRSLPPIPRPKPVSDERIAPMPMHTNCYGRQEVALNGALQDSATPRQWVDATLRLRRQFRLVG
jgi:hypothetical protein